MKFFDKSYEISRWAHNGQLRKDGKPYITHIDAVIENVRNLWNGGEGSSYAIIKARQAIEAKWGDKSLELVLSVAAWHDCRFEDQKQKFEKHPEWEKELYKLSYSREFYNDFQYAVRAISKYPKGQEEYDVYVNRVKDNNISCLVKISDLYHNLSDLEPSNLRDKYRITLFYLLN